MSAIFSPSLIATNAIAVLPAAVALIHHDLQLCVWFVLCGTVSGIYHAFYPMGETYIAEGDLSGFFALDAAVAYSTIVWVAMHIARLTQKEAAKMRLLVWCLVCIFALCMFYTVAMSYILLIAIVALAIAIISWGASVNPTEIVPTPQSWLLLAGAFACAVAATILQYVFAWTNLPASYVLYHSIWHGLLFFGSALAVQSPYTWEQTKAHVRAWRTWLHSRHCCVARVDQEGSEVPFFQLYPITDEQQ